MTKQQKQYIEWLDDTLEQAGFLSREEIDESIENLKDLFLDEKNTADICELAHAYTKLECEQLGITDIDAIDENGEVVYQDLVQPIFDKHFDFISNII